MKDQEIIHHLRGGTKLQRNQATKVLLERNFANLCKIVLAYSASPAETESNATELFRDSFVALYRSVQNPQWSLKTSQLSTYFYSIAQRIQSKKSENSRKSVFNLGGISPKHEHRVSQEVYEETLTKDDKVQTLQHAIVKLDPKCQGLIKEYYYSNASWKEIAEEEKAAPTAIRQRANLCIKKLRSIYSTLKNPRNDQ